MRGNTSFPKSSSERITLCGSSDRKSTRLNSSHSQISYAVFCLKKKKKTKCAGKRAINFYKKLAYEVSRLKFYHCYLLEVYVNFTFHIACNSRLFINDDLRSIL